MAFDFWKKWKREDGGLGLEVGVKITQVILIE